MSIPIVIEGKNSKKQIPNPNDNSRLSQMGFGICNFYLIFYFFTGDFSATTLPL